MFHWRAFQFRVAHTPDLMETARRLLSNDTPCHPPRHVAEGASIDIVALCQDGAPAGALRLLVPPLPCLTWAERGHPQRNAVRGLEIAHMAFPHGNLNGSLLHSFGRSVIDCPPESRWNLHPPGPVPDTLILLAGLLDCLVDVASVLKVTDVYHMAQKPTVDFFQHYKFPFVPIGEPRTHGPVTRTPCWARAADLFPLFRAFRHKLRRMECHRPPMDSLDPAGAIDGSSLPF